MVFSSIQDILTTLSESDDFITSVERSFYLEPVLYALKKLSTDGLTEDEVVQTVEKCTRDSELYTTMLMEHHEALSSFGISDL